MPQSLLKLPCNGACNKKQILIGTKKYYISICFARQLYNRNSTFKIICFNFLLCLFWILFTEHMWSRYLSVIEIQRRNKLCYIVTLPVHYGYEHKVLMIVFCCKIFLSSCKPLLPINYRRQFDNTTKYRYELCLCLKAISFFSTFN